MIPASQGKNISLTISVYMKTHRNKNRKINKTLQKSEIHGFVSIYASPLAKLVDNFPKNKFFLLENCFEKHGHTHEKVSMLKRTGHYPYSYLNSFEKFQKNRLSPQAKWKKPSNSSGRVQLCLKSCHRTEVVITTIALDYRFATTCCDFRSFL